MSHLESTESHDNDSSDHLDELVEEGPDALEDYTKSLLSQYDPSADILNTEGADYSRKGHFDHEEYTADNVPLSSPTVLHSLSSKIDILYTLSTRLESIWDGLFPIVEDCFNYNQYRLTLKMPEIWHGVNTIHDHQMDSISRWIEISSHILCFLVTRLNISDENNALDDGSKLLQKVLDDKYSSTKFASDTSKAWDDSSTHEKNIDYRRSYLRAMHFNTQMQSHYERVIDKMLMEQDLILTRTEDASVLEMETRALRDRISVLEAELAKKYSEIEALNNELKTANRTQIQLVQKNSRLLEQNRKLLLEKGGNVGNTVSQHVQYSYLNEITEGEIKEERLQLLERIVDIDLKYSKGNELDNNRSLLNEFMDFINEEQPSGEE